ncbi:hypothetical protein ABPG77_001095 [Micractinium sp. CCAP 211/92]
MGAKGKRAQPATTSNGGGAVPASAAASGPVPACKAASLKEAEGLFKKFKQKSDAKLVPRLRAALEASPSAAGHIMLAKAMVLLALETSLRKGSPQPASLAARMAEAGAWERKLAEDALEAEVVGLLMEALEQAFLGVSAEGKHKSLRCVYMAAQLLGMMRGRGSAEQVARRLELGGKLAAQVNVMLQLELQASQRGTVGIPWLPVSAEGPPPRWPFEADGGVGPVGKLQQASTFLDDARQEDERAREYGDPVWAVPCALLRAPEEGHHRVQERLTSWPLLPRESRAPLAHKYLHIRLGGELENEALAMVRDGEPAAAPRLTVRREKQRITAAEAKAEQLSRAAERAAAERQKKAEAAAVVAAAAAQRRAARAQIFGQELAKRVAAAGNSREAQMEALVGSLRLSVEDMRQQALRLGREEWSEAEAARFRAALERLPSGQQWLFCWDGAAMAALPGEQARAPGASGASSGGASFIADATPKRVQERLAEAISCRAEDVRSLVAPEGDCPEVLSWLFDRCKAPADLSLYTAPELCSPACFLPNQLVSASRQEPLPDDMRLMAGLTGNAAARRAALASVYTDAADIYTHRLQAGAGATAVVAAEVAAPPGTAAPDSLGAAHAAPTADGGQPAAASPSEGGPPAAASPSEGGPPAALAAQEVQAAGAACWQPAPAGDAPPHMLRHNPMSDLLHLTWLTINSITRGLTAVETVEQPLLLDEPYGLTADIVRLLACMLMGQRLEELLEAQHHDKQPAGWEWWHYKALDLALASLDAHHAPEPMHGLAALQPDQHKLREAAELMDAFNRWYLGAHRCMDAYLLGQGPAEAPSQQAPEQPLVGAADGAAAAGPPTGTAGAAGEAVAAATGKHADEELEPYSSPLPWNEVLADWVLRGLAAASLAQVAVPPEVAAAAAAAAQGDSGGASALAAWVCQHNEEETLRVLHMLAAMQRDNALPEQLLDTITAFVVSQPGVYELVQSPAAQRHLQESVAAGVGILAEATPAQQAVLLEALQQLADAAAQAAPTDGPAEHEHAQGDIGVGVNQSVPAIAALALLPLIPLSSLHQVLAFVQVQLCWSSRGMQSVWEALKPGEEGLMAALTEVQPGSGKASSKEVALTRAGLEWLLVSCNHPQAPFTPDHFQVGEAPAADMAAQLAALIQLPRKLSGTAASECPAGKRGAVPGSESAGSNCSRGRPERAEQEGSSGTLGQPEGSISQELISASCEVPAGTAAGHPSRSLPSHLRLGTAAASHQPPSTLQERLRLLAAVPGPGFSGVLRKDDAAELASSVASARAALFYLHTVAVAANHTNDLFDEVQGMALDPDLAALKEWLKEEPEPAFGPQLPSRQAQAPEERLQAAMLLVHAASAGEHLVSMAELAQLALHAQQAAACMATLEGAHLPAAERAVLQAATEEERKEAEATVQACKQNLDQWRSLLEQADKQLQRHKVLEICKARRKPTPAFMPRFRSLLEAVRTVEWWRHQGIQGSPPDSARQEAEQAATTALHLIDDLEGKVQNQLDNAYGFIAWLNECSTALSRRLHIATASALAKCRVHVPWLLARSMVRDLLPSAWEAELSTAKAAEDARALLLEEEKERQRQQQAEAERREAERRAKTRKARRAAGMAGGGASKGAMRADWRAELADVAAGEADGEELSEDEDEVKPLTEEQAANLAGLWEEAEGDDDEEWQQAGAAGRQQQQQQRRRKQLHRQRDEAASLHNVPLSGPAAAVITAPRPASAAPGMVLRGQQPQTAAAAANGPVSAADGGTDSRGCEQGGWEEQAPQLEEDDDMEALLAILNIHPEEQAPLLVAESAEEDDPDLAAAIAASLAHASGPPPQSPVPGSYAAAAGGYAAAIAMGSRDARAGSPEAGKPGLAGAVGLRNEAGEYNCFLNVIVQCLWRCADFRQQVASWGPEVLDCDPVLAALHGLFQAFQQQQQQQQQQGERGMDASSAASAAASSALPSPVQPASAWGPQRSPRSPEGREQTVVDPTPLRQALAALPGRSFQQGEMQDAAEVLLCAYERIIQAYEEQRSRQLQAAGGAALPPSTPTELQLTFGLAVREEVHCGSCGKTTHQAAYEQFFYTTQATGLRYMFEASPSSTTGCLLRELEAQHSKSCDEDMGGCGMPNSVNHFLERAPRVFTLQLTWESHSEQPADIAATLAAIDEEIDLGEVYQGTERGSHRYRLRSMVCYYGQHYQALVLVPEAGGWLVFDDTRVARVGGWDAVRRKCEAGRIQPSVLFYEAV